MKLFFRAVCLLLLAAAAATLAACASPSGEEENASPGSGTADATETLPAEEVREPEYLSALPKAVQAKSVYLISEPSSFADKLTLATLQGLAAGKTEDQILIQSGALDNYRIYLTKQWKCGVKMNVDGNAITLASLLEHYLPQIDGYILAAADNASESGSVAVSLAGLLNAVVVTPINEKVCKNLGMTCLLDVRDKKDDWLRSSEYWDRLNKSVAFEQPLAMAPKLVDYAVLCRAYFSFYNGHSRAEHSEKYAFLDDGAIVLGYNNTLGEYDTVYSYSDLNVQMIASDHATNLSTLSGFVAPHMEQKTAREEQTAPGNVHTVCIVLSDGDNLQWLLNDFTLGNKWFGNAKRGSFAMGWGLPALTVDLAAPMEAYLYDKMTKNDEFILQLSGLGYTFPSKWETGARQAMTGKLAEYMKRSDIRFAEILDDKGMEESVLSDFTMRDGIDGLFYIDYFDYAGMKGKTIWTNGKPTVSARYRIWEKFEDASIETVAQQINAAPKDPGKIDSYSFVIVHAWSGLSGNTLTSGGNTLDAVAKLISSFEEGVEVVAPSVFMDRIIVNGAR